MKTLQLEIKDFLKARKWWPPAPADAAKSIMIEGAELLEHFQWSSPSVAKVKSDAKLREAVGAELADIIIYSLQMSEALGLDAETLVREKMKHNGQKYPAAVITKNRKAYLEIKKAYRRAANS